jgi:hypothetical protein
MLWAPFWHYIPWRLTVFKLEESVVVQDIETEIQKLIRYYFGGRGQLGWKLLTFCSIFYTQIHLQKLSLNCSPLLIVYMSFTKTVDAC